MEINGLAPNQVVQVRGYADQWLRVPTSPEDASNRRISVIVQYVEKSKSAPDAAAPEDEPKNEEPKKGVAAIERTCVAS